MDLKVVPTKDGSNTLFCNEHHATYRSRNGAFNESEHVFIEHGLKYVQHTKTNPIFVLEVGYGTGLNAMLTAKFAVLNKIEVNYTGIDRVAIAERLCDELNYKAKFEKAHHFIVDALNTLPYNKPSQLTSHFKINKCLCEFSEMQWNNKYHLIYFDVFSPNETPWLWTKEVFEKLYSVLEPGGVLVTFCAKGQFKRDLREVGFKVEVLPGAPGKREMTRAIKKI